MQPWQWFVLAIPASVLGTSLIMIARILLRSPDPGATARPAEDDEPGYDHYDEPDAFEAVGLMSTTDRDGWDFEPEPIAPEPIAPEPSGSSDERAAAQGSFGRRRGRSRIN